MRCTRPNFSSKDVYKQTKGTQHLLAISMRCSHFHSNSILLNVSLIPWLKSSGNAALKSAIFCMEWTAFVNGVKYRILHCKLFLCYRSWFLQVNRHLWYQWIVLNSVKSFELFPCAKYSKFTEMLYYYEARLVHFHLLCIHVTVSRDFMHIISSILEPMRVFPKEFSIFLC